MIPPARRRENACLVNQPRSHLYFTLPLEIQRFICSEQLDFATLSRNVHRMHTRFVPHRSACTPVVRLLAASSSKCFFHFTTNILFVCQ